MPESKDAIPRQIIRCFIEQFVHVCVIQVGCNQGYTPNVEFARIPNHDFLLYLSDSVAGTFLYASDLPYVSNEEFNFYHKLFILRNLDLSRENAVTQRPVDSVRVSNSNTDNIDPITQEELTFPWFTNTLTLIGFRILYRL